MSGNDGNSGTKAMDIDEDKEKESSIPQDELKGVSSDEDDDDVEVIEESGKREYVHRDPNAWPRKVVKPVELTPEALQYLKSQENGDQMIEMMSRGGSLDLSQLVKMGCKIVAPDLKGKVRVTKLKPRTIDLIEEPVRDSSTGLRTYGSRKRLTDCSSSSSGTSPSKIMANIVGARKTIPLGMPATSGAINLRGSDETTPTTEEPTFLFDRPVFTEFNRITTDIKKKKINDPRRYPVLEPRFNHQSPRPAEFQPIFRKVGSTTHTTGQSFFQRSQAPTGQPFSSEGTSTAPVKCSFTFCKCVDRFNPANPSHLMFRDMANYGPSWNDFLTKCDPWRGRKSRRPRICSCHFKNHKVSDKPELKAWEYQAVISRLQKENETLTNNMKETSEKLKKVLRDDQIKLILDHKYGQKIVWSHETMLDAIKVKKYVSTVAYDEIFRILRIPFPKNKHIHEYVRGLETSIAKKTNTKKKQEVSKTTIEVDESYVEEEAENDVQEIHPQEPLTSGSFIPEATPIDLNENDDNDKGLIQEDETPAPKLQEVIDKVINADAEREADEMKKKEEEKRKLDGMKEKAIERRALKRRDIKLPEDDTLLSQIVAAISDWRETTNQRVSNNGKIMIDKYRLRGWNPDGTPIIGSKAVVPPNAIPNIPPKNGQMSRNRPGGRPRPERKWSKKKGQEDKAGLSSQRGNVTRLATHKVAPNHQQDEEPINFDFLVNAMIND